MTALVTLRERQGDRPFAVREIYSEMLTHGTGYSELTVPKAMQRMKEPDPRLPLFQLERVGQRGFRLIGA